MLVVGQAIRLPFGGIYRVESVSQSRAYCTPISKVKDKDVEPDAGDVPGAKSISPNAFVEVIPEEDLAAEIERPKPAPVPKPTKQGRVEMASVAAIPTARKDKDRRVNLARKRADKHAGLPGTGGKSRLAGAAARSAAGKRATVTKTVRNCACGCGEETMSYFAPGHDARVHGVIKKLADGRLEPKEYPYQSLIKSLQLSKTAKGYKAAAPHFWLN